MGRTGKITSNLMKDYTRNLIVGITAVAGLVGLATMTILFGYAPQWLESGYVVQIQMNRSGGLIESSRVRLNGIDVGRITSVQLQDPPTKGVMLQAMIREQVRIPEQANASVAQPLLGGTPALVFTVSHIEDAQEMVYLPTDGTGKITGSSATLYDKLADSLREPAEAFGRLSNRFETLSEEWEQVGRNLRDLTDPRTTAEVDGGADATLASTMARADARLRDMKEVIDNINRWVGDEQLQADVRETVASTKDFTSRMNESAEKVDAIVNDARGLITDARTTVSQTGENVDAALTRYVAVADELSAAVDSMRTSLAAVENGKGTMGKMVNDPELYHNMNESMSQLEQAIIDFRLLIKKWQAEGVPIQF